MRMKSNSINTIITSGGVSVTINGKSYSGSNITMNGGDIYVDGKRVDDKEIVSAKEITINITGDVNSVSAPGNVTINGNAKKVEAGGSVSIKGNVEGDVDAGNSVTCGNVGGDVDAGNSVTCGDIDGDADAGGNIYRR